MATVSKDLYDRLIANRPFKLSADEIDYRDSVEQGGEERCGNCVHLFQRVKDKFQTCEIFRPSDDVSIDSNYVCDFHSTDGESFPLLES